jgi:hypothetical protein
MTGYGLNKVQYNEAVQRVKFRMKVIHGFRLHLIIYIVLNVFLIASYLLDSSIQGKWEYLWLPWPIVFLTGLLLAHFLGVYVFTEDFRAQLLGKELAKRKLEFSPAGSIDPKYGQATAQAKAKMVFYWHGVIYLIVNGLCLVSYLVPSLMLGSWLYPWVLWSTASLTVLLFCHYIGVYPLGRYGQHLLEEALAKLP